PRSPGDDPPPPVLGAAGLGLVARDRLRLAPTLHADAGRVDALRDHVVPHRLRAPLGELLVVGVRADRVGVTLDRDLHARLVLHHRDPPAPHLLARGLERRLVEAELDRKTVVWGKEGGPGGESMDE